MGRKKTVKAATAQRERVYRKEVYASERYEVETAEECSGLCMYEIVPFRGRKADSMEHIADITEEFSQSMDPILRM